MTAPRRRVWMYAPSSDVVEILVLGSTDDVAGLFPSIKNALERWPGFWQTEIVATGNHCGALRAKQTIHATAVDSLAEALCALREFVKMPRGYEWHIVDHGNGIVGTW